MLLATPTPLYVVGTYSAHTIWRIVAYLVNDLIRDFLQKILLTDSAFCGS
jgi:hypothetical protein